eukprot:gene13736-19637_t
MQLSTTVYVASCLLAIMLLSHGAAAARLKAQVLGRSLAAKEINLARMLEGSDCEAGFYPSPSSPPVYGAYPPGPSPPSYPPSYPPTYPPTSCTPCPAGSTSPAGASTIDECTACAAGFTSPGAGGACQEIIVPGIDLSKQRDVMFEFLGPDFTAFQAESQADRNSFNSTITDRMAAAISNEGVWVYIWRSGSIVTDNRVTFAEGTSAGNMDAAIRTLADNAAAVFGDLSAFGVTGVRGQALNENEDDDDNALAIGLGVGLGVGIPLLAGLIFFFILRSRRGEQTVAPNAKSSTEEYDAASHLSPHRLLPPSSRPLVPWGRDSFNSTITGKMAAAISSEGVWLYTWRSGSIATYNRVTFAEGTSAGDMDAAIRTLAENAVAVFGDLSAFGVTGVRSEALNENEDGDDNALAIGLGVGLGVGIPVIAAIIVFCFWKRHRDNQTVAPNSSV